MNELLLNTMPLVPTTIFTPRAPTKKNNTENNVYKLFIECFRQRDRFARLHYSFYPSALFSN